MKSNKSKYLFLATFVVCLVVISAVYMRSQNAQTITRTASKASLIPKAASFNNPNQLSVTDSINSPMSVNYAELARKAEEVGSVRVIVGLNVDFTPMSKSSENLRLKQELDINNAQTSFLSKISKERGFVSETTRTYKYIPYIALEVNAELLEELRRDPQVKSIEEDMILAPTLAESNAIIGSANVWNLGYNGTGKAVAILDTGVDKNHQFLAGKVVSEACYSSNVSGTATSVCPGGVTSSTAENSGLHCSLSITGCNHGTHVAGIAAGVNQTISGVARSANIIAIQVFSSFSSATNCGDNPTPCALTYNSDYLKGLERVYELSNTIDVASVNMSLGGGQNAGYCDTSNPSIKAAIDNLRARDIPTVIATGNNGFANAMGFPACISTAVSVGNTGDGSNGAPLDTVWTSSNSTATLHLLAPGRWIQSSVPHATSTNAFANFSGTSMAAPHVAGAWAVFKQFDPDASVDDILNAMTYSGQRITDTRNGMVFPRLNMQGTYNFLNNGQPAPLSGTVNVGTGQQYTSLTNLGGLFHTINVAGISGDLTINITSNLTGETGGHQLNQAVSTGVGNYLITIRPSGAARTITGTSATMTGLINLNGADRVTIDGSLTEGGTDRSLTINNNQATNSAVVWIRSAGAGNGANNITVRNTVLYGAPGPNSMTTIGILSGGSVFGNDAEAANNDMTIENNWIYRVQNSLYLRGGAGANFDQNLRVLNNELGSSVENDNNIFRGMLFGNTQNFMVAGNLIHGIRSTATATGAVNGIQLAFSVNGGVIAGNRVTSVSNTSLNGTGAFGITLGAASTASNVVVANNIVSGVSAIGSATVGSNGHGINIASGGGYSIYYNSVNMNIDQASGTTSALLVGSGITAAGTLNVRNNIFANTQTAGAARSAVHSFAAASVYSDINHNNYFSTENVGFMGQARVTLADWQTATGRDQNSLSIDPLFISSTDLHLQSGSPMAGAGTPIAGITTDFDGDTRSASTPTIGADEVVVMQSFASLSGRVTAANGRGLPNARIQISGGGLSSPIYANTSSFGYYSLPTLATGQTYVITVSERRHTFTVSSINVMLNGNVNNVDFVAN